MVDRPPQFLPVNLIHCWTYHSIEEAKEFFCGTEILLLQYDLENEHDTRGPRSGPRETPATEGAYDLLEPPAGRTGDGAQ